MVDSGDDREARALWRRWRDSGGATAPEPEALALAAYAEGRLNEIEAETVEAWLAANPDAVADIVAARAINHRPPSLVFEGIVTHACDLVAGKTTSSNVVNLRHTAPSSWRNALAWSGIAASLLAVSLVGFSMGSNAYMNLSGTRSADVSSVDGPDATGSIDVYFSDDFGT